MPTAMVSDFDPASRGWAENLSNLLDASPGETANWATIITADDVEQYFKNVLEAFSVHIDRERIRRGLWKQYPAIDQVRKIVQKGDRNMRTLDLVQSGQVSQADARDQMLEELDDIINYAIFAKRIIRGDIDG